MPEQERTVIRQLERLIIVNSGSAPLPTYKPDLVAGLYRPLQHGRWELRKGGTVLTRGYWSPPQLVHDMVALLRDGETWMSITPMEIESQEIGVQSARGHVVVFGMGMGWAAAASALRTEVDRVTVVERDHDVIALHDKLCLFDALPNNAGEKISVEAGDALDWSTSEPVDLLMADIWLPLLSTRRIDEVRRMQANVGAKQLYFWGQEMEIARHAAAQQLGLDDDVVDHVVSSFKLPLVSGGTGYAKRITAAADAWMQDRWLA